MGNELKKSVASYDSSYSDWKGWDHDRFGSVSRGDHAYYESEISRVRCRSDDPLDVLEIGFGNGRFLAFARAKGWRVVGIEVNQELVELASGRGFNVFLSSDLEKLVDRSFDVIVAFDVLEHLKNEEIIDLLRHIKRLLKDDNSVFIARFPNGDSPLGLINQNSDVTHLTTIGSGKINYFASRVGLRVMFLGAEAVPVLSSKNLSSIIYRLIVIPVRMFIELAVRFIYFPRSNIVFGAPNLVVVLRR